MSAAFPAFIAEERRAATGSPIAIDTRRDSDSLFCISACASGVGSGGGSPVCSSSEPPSSERSKKEPRAGSSPTPSLADFCFFRYSRTEPVGVIGTCGGRGKGGG